MNETYLFNRDSLLLDKLSFKLLFITIILADDNLAYRGTINEIAVSLGYSAKKDTRRNNRIKAAIETLKKHGFIKVIEDGNGYSVVYTLTLSRIAEKDKAIRIQKKWIEKYKKQLMQSGMGVDWSYTIKVLLYLVDIAIDSMFDDFPHIYTISEIAIELQASDTQVRFALKALEQYGIIERRAIYKNKTDAEGFLIQFRRIGTEITLNSLCIDTIAVSS